MHTKPQDDPQNISPLLGRSCSVCHCDERETVFPARLPKLVGQLGDVLHYTYDEKVANANRWHYNVVRCKKCGHRYSGSVFDSKTIEDSYLTQEHDNEFGLSRDVLLKTQVGYANVLERFLPDNRDLQVDIGCDTGLFLLGSEYLGFTEVIGVEPGRGSAEKARATVRARILNRIFDPSDFEDDSINLATMIHVLDHLTDCRQLIRDLKPKMKKGGIVFAVVHNIDSFVARLSGKSWAPLNLVHLEFFSPDSLRKLFEAEGYKVLTVVSTKNYFPLSHLIRFAPYLPATVREQLLKITRKEPVRSVLFGLMLGNIGVVAKKL